MSESLERSVAIVAAAMALSAGVTVGVAAEKTLPVDLKIGADAVSKYVWRGQLLTDDPVFQPTATVSYKGLSLNLWGSLDMTDIHETSGHIWRLQELDYTLAYAYSPLDGLDLQAGATAYTFPGTTFASTTEVYASAALSKVLLAPTLTVYRDIDEADSWYAEEGDAPRIPASDLLYPGSPQFNTILKNFEDNVEKVISAAERRSIPVVFWKASAGGEASGLACRCMILQ